MSLGGATAVAPDGRARTKRGSCCPPARGALGVVSRAFVGSPEISLGPRAAPNCEARSRNDEILSTSLRSQFGEDVQLKELEQATGGCRPCPPRPQTPHLGSTPWSESDPQRLNYDHTCCDLCDWSKRYWASCIPPASIEVEKRGYEGVGEGDVGTPQLVTVLEHIVRLSQGGAYILLAIAELILCSTS